MTQLKPLGSQWQPTYSVYESEALDLLCAYEGGTAGAIQLSVTGGDGIVEGKKLPVSEATDGSCLPNNSMVVEWTTTNLTLRREMNGKEINCSGISPPGDPISMLSSLDVQCKYVCCSYLGQNAFLIRSKALLTHY